MRHLAAFVLLLFSTALHAQSVRLAPPHHLRLSPSSPHPIETSVPLPSGCFGVTLATTPTVAFVGAYQFVDNNYNALLLAFDLRSHQWKWATPLPLPGNQVPAAISPPAAGVVDFFLYSDATRPASLLVARLSADSGTLLSVTPVPEGSHLPAATWLPRLDTLAVDTHPPAPPPQKASDSPSAPAARFAFTACVPATDPTPADCDTDLIEDALTPGALGARTPLILIHDAWATASIAAPDRTYWNSLLAAFAAAPQFQSKYKLFRFHYLTGRHNSWDLARSLRNRLDALIANFPEYDTRFTLIAHGLGGLIARSYMDHHWHWAGSSLSPYRARRAGERVNAVITLATPHHGTPLFTAATLAAQAVTTAAWAARGCTSCANLAEYSTGIAVSPDFDHKVIAYWGYLQTNSTIAALARASAAELALHRSWEAAGIALARLESGNSSEASAELSLFNDGYVPASSAAFDFGFPSKRVACPGYDHLLMLYGSTAPCANGQTLLHSILADLDAPAGALTPPSPPPTPPYTPPPGCTYSLTPASIALAPTASTASVAVSSPSGCPLHVQSHAPWITITATSPASFTYLVDTNPSPMPRFGLITVSGAPFYVVQASITGACAWDTAPGFRSHASSSFSSTLAILAPSSCTWTPAADSPWLTVSPSTPQSGVQILILSGAANSNTTPRYGALQLTTGAGGTLTIPVEQSGTLASCTYSLSSSLSSLPATTATGAFTIQTQPACPWLLLSGASWLTLTGAASGTGAATIPFSITANTGKSRRFASITVLAGSTSLSHAVAQDIASPLQPDIHLPVTTIAMGNSLVDRTTYQTLTVQNTGQATLYVSSVTQLSGSLGFKVEAPLPPIAPGRAANLVLSYTPGAQVSQSAVFRIASNDPDEPAVDFTLTGAGIAATTDGTLLVAPTLLHFGDVAVGEIAELPLTLQNRGSAAVNLSYNWTQSGNFQVLGAPSSLPGNSAATLRLRLTPSAAGAQSATFTVTSSGAGNPSFSVALSGTGIAAPAPSIQSAASFSFTGAGTPTSITIAHSRAFISRSNPPGLTVVDLTSGATTAHIPISFYPTALTGQPAATANRAFVPLSNLGSNGQVAVIDLATNTVSQFLPAGSEPAGAALTPTQLFIANANCPAAGALSMVRSFDAASLTPLETFLAGRVANFLAYDEATARLVVTSAGCGAESGAGVSVIDLNTQSLLATRSLRQSPAAVAVSAGKALVNTGQTLEVINLSSLETLASIPIPAPSSGVAVIANHALVASSGAVTAIDLTTYRIRGSVPVPGVITVAADPISGVGYALTSTSLLALRLPQPAFEFTCSPPTLLSPSSTCTVTPSSGFSSPVTLSCHTVASAACSFSPASATPPFQSTLTVAPGAAPPGVFPIRAEAAGGGVAHSLFLAQTLPTCTLAVSATSFTLPSGGGSRSVSVASPTNCSWTAVSHVPWITITAGAASAAPATVTFDVAPNDTEAGRTGTLTVAGTTVTVNQQPHACSTAPAATVSWFGPTGGASDITVTMSAPTCSWSASTDTDWITLTSPAAGAGSGAVSFTIAPLPMVASRTGAITVNGVPVTITQYGFAPQNRLPTASIRRATGGILLATYPSSSFSLLSGSFAGDPAAAQDSNGNTIVASLDRFGGSWVNVHYAASQTWGQIRFGGGQFTGNLSVTVAASGIAFLAGRDRWNAYWVNTYSLSSGFTGWVNLGGVFTTDPLIAASPDGGVYVVGKDSGGGLWSNYFLPAAGWQGWTFGGGVVRGKPALAVGADSVAYLAVRDNFNTLWMARLRHSRWLGWAWGGGAGISADPMIAANGVGTLFVAVLTYGGSVSYRGFSEGTSHGWHGWVQTSGVLTAASAGGSTGEFYIFGIDPNRTHWWFRAGASQWIRVGNTDLSTGAPSVAPR